MTDGRGNIRMCSESKRYLGDNEISTDCGPSTIDYDLDANKRAPEEEASDAGNSIWGAKALRKGTSGTW